IGRFEQAVAGLEQGLFNPGTITPFHVSLSTLAEPRSQPLPRPRQPHFQVRPRYGQDRFNVPQAALPEVIQVYESAILRGQVTQRRVQLLLLDVLRFALHHGLDWRRLAVGDCLGHAPEKPLPPAALPTPRVEDGAKRQAIDPRAGGRLP